MSGCRCCGGNVLGTTPSSCHTETFKSKPIFKTELQSVTSVPTWASQIHNTDWTPNYWMLVPGFDESCSVVWLVSGFIFSLTVTNVFIQERIQAMFIWKASPHKQSVDIGLTAQWNQPHQHIKHTSTEVPGNPVNKLLEETTITADVNLFISYGIDFIRKVKVNLHIV